MPRFYKNRKKFGKETDPCSFVLSWFKNIQHKIEKNIGFMWSVSSMFIEYRNIIDASSGPFQTSEMQCFAKIVNDFCRLPIFAKQTILEISQGSENTSL